MTILARTIFSALVWIVSTPLIAAELNPGACGPADVTVTTTPTPEQIPASLRKAESLAQQATETPSPDTVAVGDSITARWPEGSLRTALGAKALVKLGVEGDKTQNVLWRLSNPAFASWKPTKVVMLIGTNNLTSGDSACAIVAGIRSIVSRIDALWGKPQLRLITVLPRGAGFSFRESDRAVINDGLRSIARARKNTKVLDPGDAMACGRAEPCENFHDDRLHPTQAGYLILDAMLTKD